MSSDKVGGRSVRSHSIHIAMGRDYERIQMAKKQDLKLEKEFLNFERRLSSHAKWNQRIDSKNINTQKRPSITLEEFMQREKIKQDNKLNAKRLANQNIRRN